MFKRKKKKDGFQGKTKLKPLKYSPKILIAWSEAIGGNKDIRDWFMSSEEFKELGIAVHALELDDDARDWLVENGFAHLLAMINGVEGNKDALRWLEQNKFNVLRQVALSGDGNEDAYEWLILNNHPELALISMKIRTLKDNIEEENNDVHKINRS